MNAKKIFYNTLIISIIVQVITGILQIGALFLNIPRLLIKQLMILDLLVQLLEGTFYGWLTYHYAKVSDITPKRYIDWMITTPTMLVTLILYLIYLNTENRKELQFFQMVKDNSNVIIPVLCLNWAMLFFGYLSEIKYIPTIRGVGLGFIPFLMYYYMIYVNYVTQYTTIFWYFFFFWGLYGIAALFPYYIKNACYNILDLFSKNFFGIFLSYLIIFKIY